MDSASQKQPGSLLIHRRADVLEAGSEVISSECHPVPLPASASDPFVIHWGDRQREFILAGCVVVLMAWYPRAFHKLAR